MWLTDSRIRTLTSSIFFKIFYKFHNEVWITELQFLYVSSNHPLPLCVHWACTETPSYTPINPQTLGADCHHKTTIIINKIYASLHLTPTHFRTRWNVPIFDDLWQCKRTRESRAEGELEDVHYATGDTVIWYFTHSLPLENLKSAVEISGGCYVASQLCPLGMKARQWWRWTANETLGASGFLCVGGMDMGACSEG